MKMQVRDEAELKAAIAGAKGPLRIQGGGTRRVADGSGSGAGAGSGSVLSLSGLSGITLYEPGALTLVARAGTPVAEIEAALAAEGQRLAFEPYFLRQGASTIGGVVATNASGPRRIQVGAARDFLLGVRFVDGNGRAVHNGGRVMKNVTGYDLVKLMAGSRGTLGALSEVSLKVLPLPESEATLCLPGLDADQAVPALSRLLGSPFEVSGAAFGPIMEGKGTVFARVEGFADSVAYRLGKLGALMAAFGAVETLDAQQSRETWAGIRDVTSFQAHPFLARMSIKPSALPEFLADTWNILAKDESHQAPFDVLADWGGGLVWIACGDAAAARHAAVGRHGGADPVLNGYQVLHETLQGYCARAGGHVTLMRAPEGLAGRVSLHQPEAPGVAALSAGLRARFDPRGLFRHEGQV